MTDTSPTRRFQIVFWSPGICVVVAILVLSEILVRTSVVQYMLPEDNLYYQQGVKTRVKALHDTIRARGTVDVLFIGSSIVRTDIAPLVFDSRYSRNTGKQVVSFNGGLSGLGLDENRLYLDHFWLQHCRPKVVIQGVRFSEINRAPSAKHGSLIRGQIESMWIDGSDAFQIKETVLQHIHLLHFRGELVDTLRHFQRGMDFEALNDKHDLLIDARGHGTRQRTLGYLRLRGGDREYGQVEHGGLKLLDFSFALATLASTIEICHQQKIDYVLVNIPEHADRWAGAHGEQLYEKYLSSVRELAAKYRVPFVDVTDGDPTAYGDDALFMDFHHMNYDGADTFSKELADRLSTLCVN